MTPTEKGKIAEIAGVSGAAVSKALRSGRLEEINGKIDLDSDLTRTFIAQAINRKQNGNEQKAIKSLPAVHYPETKQTKIIETEPSEVAQAMAQKIIEEAKYKEQQRIKLELANATTRAELLRSDLVNKYLMTLLDRQRNANKREFADFINDFITDIKEDRKSRNELKRMALQMMDNWHFDAVHELKKEMEELEEEQGRR